MLKHGLRTLKLRLDRVHANGTWEDAFSSTSALQSRCHTPSRGSPDISSVIAGRGGALKRALADL